MAKGILLVGFDYTTAHADEFHDWYDLEHVPERQRVRGFGLCERWISVANPKHAVASYDLDSLAVLESEPYRAIAHENLSAWSKRVTAMCTAAHPFRWRADSARQCGQPVRCRRVAGERHERGRRMRCGVQ